MEKRALLLVVLTAIIAGSAGVLIKSMSSMTPTAIAGIRLALPAAVIGIYLKLNGSKIFKKNYGKMLIASSLNAFRLYFFFMAYIYTTVGSAVIILYTYPLFVSLLGYFFLKERMSKMQWVFLFTAFIGIIIAYSHKEFSFEDEDFVGMAAALVSGFVYSITVILFKSESQNYTSTESLFYQNIVGGIVFLPFFILDFPSIEMSHLAVCLGYTLVIGLVMFKLFFISLQYIQASVHSAIMYLEIVSAILFSYFFLDERLTPNVLIGGALIVISSIMISRYRLLDLKHK